MSVTIPRTGNNATLNRIRHHLKHAPPDLFVYLRMRTYGALPNTTTTMVQAIDEREVPLSRR
jgi:hypothetical protein